MIGGDIRGDNKTEVWDALANSIRSIDKGHLMTFHPRGRTTSATWFNDREWLDFNMFQSGHRRYGQRFGDGDYPIEENTEEDNVEQQTNEKMEEMKQENQEQQPQATETQAVQGQEPAQDGQPQAKTQRRT